MKNLIVTSGMAVGGLLTRCGAAAACPACAQALDQANSRGTGPMTTAFETSILFMFVVPYVLLAAFAFSFYWLYRRGLAAKASATVESAAAENLPVLSASV